MPQPVKVYRWDDVGAPSMGNGKPSEIIDVLTKCLVDGYGSKSPLGWTRPFYDAAVQAAVFRNNVASGGSGGYVKFFSSNGSDANNADMRITHALSMTGINDFFRQGFTQAFQSQTGTPGPTGTKADKWVVIGSAIGFYFFISRASVTMNSITNYNATMYAGDFYSAIAADTSRFIAVVSPVNGDTAAAASAGSTLDALGTTSSTAVACLKIYDADNFSNFVPYSLNVISGTFTTLSNEFAAIPVGEHILLPVLIWYTGAATNSPTKDRLNVMINDSFVSPLVRGVLPGIGFSFKAGYRGATWPVTKSLGGKLHWLLRSTTGSGSACAGWINMEEWNDPFGMV